MFAPPLLRGGENSSVSVGDSWSRLIQTILSNARTELHPRGRTLREKGLLQIAAPERAKTTHLKKLKGGKQLARFLFPPENLEPLKCWWEERFLIGFTGHLDNGSGQSTADELRVTL